MLFKKRLRKASVQEEQDYRERMETVPFLDKLIMVLTAYGIIVLPCLLVLLGMVLLVSWVLGLL